VNNDKLSNILEYLLDNLEWYGIDKGNIIYEDCLNIRKEVFSDKTGELTFDVIPKIPTEDK
jgi:hypothetical protein